MTPHWEVDGLFGNEYAMERAVEELKKVKEVEFKQLDRRNLRVLLKDDGIGTRELVKNIIKIAHGFVENDGPVGELDRKIAKKKEEKLKAIAEKKRLDKH